MPKSPAERKGARARGSPPPVSARLSWCSTSRKWRCWRVTAPPGPGRDPYEMAEYIALLIRQDDARVRGRINAISKRRCGKCGDQLPVASCPCAGDSQCWATLGWHETKLPL